MHACNPSTLGGRGRQISELETSLVYRVSSRTARAIQKNQIQKTKKKKKFFFVYYVYEHTVAVFRQEKRVSDLFRMVVSHHVDAGI